ncbi:MAG: hypothetical protein ACI3YG_08060 [Prevotella sp.]
MKIKISYLSDLICSPFDNEKYEKYREWAINIFLIGSACLGLTTLLSLLFYNGIISWFLSLFLGGSLLFIAYIAAIIFLLDKRIEIEVSGYYNSLSDIKDEEILLKYKRTKYYCFFLILMGIAAIYFTGKYKAQYAFNCRDCYIEADLGIFHTYDECEELNLGTARKLKGYQIDVNSYRLCPNCEEIAEEYRELEAERYARRP